VRVKVDVPPDRGDLIPQAQLAWQAFGRAIPHYYRSCEVEFGTTDEEPNGMAMARAHFATVSPLEKPDSAHVLLSTRFLTDATELERHLTLLHETIHLHLALGAHRVRVEKYQTRLRAAETAVRLLWADEATLRFRWTQLRMAFQLFQLPDEIAAEQLLRRDFPIWLGARADYYLRMRREEVALLPARVEAAGPFGPLVPFYADLRASLYVPLAEGAIQIQQELKALSTHCQADFIGGAPEAFRASCLELKPLLLDVSLERPIESSNAAYERLFKLIEGVKPPPPRSTK
jgi:hypothetical protein